jgi:hypothetical protein
MKNRVLAIARRLVFLTLVPVALLVAVAEHVTWGRWGALR